MLEDWLGYAQGLDDQVFDLSYHLLATFFTKLSLNSSEN
jgi:hypothetical protein